LRIAAGLGLIGWGLTGRRADVAFLGVDVRRE